MLTAKTFDKKGILWAIRNALIPGLAEVEEIPPIEESLSSYNRANLTGIRPVRFSFENKTFHYRSPHQGYRIAMRKAGELPVRF